MYLINTALISLYDDHEHAMINEYEIGNNHSTCTLDIREISDGRVDGVEAIAYDVESKIIK